MDTDRRSFLKFIGFGAGAIAFAPNVPWLFAENVVPYGGPFTFDWLAAEATAIIASCIPRMELSRESSGVSFFGCDLFIPCDLSLHDKPLEEIREQYISPVAHYLASEVNFIRPKFCIPMRLPDGVEYAHRVIDKDRGLSLRYTRAIDILQRGFVNRFDIAVAA